MAKLHSNDNRNEGDGHPVESTYNQSMLDSDGDSDVGWWLCSTVKELDEFTDTEDENTSEEESSSSSDENLDDTNQFNGVDFVFSDDELEEEIQTKYVSI